MNKAFKFRAYPNQQQQNLINQTFGCVRMVYNHFLSLRIKEYNDNKRTLSCYDCIKQLPSLKSEKQFLKNVDSIALQQSVRHLDTAYQNFFKQSKAGFPKFKSKRNSKKSYTTNYVNDNIVLSDSHIKLPKIGMLKIKRHRSVPDNYRLKSVTVSQNASGKYYVSILFEYDQDVILVKPDSFLGLDFSMHELYTDSNGNNACYPRFYRQAEKRLAKAQRKLSHMQKYSCNYFKQKRKVAILHERASNQRKDFLHKQSKTISKSYDCVCIEDLDIQAMSKSLKFGKSVHDNAWGTFVSFLQYKLKDMGKPLIKIDKWFPSSQICSNCGEQNSITKDLSVRQWICPVCGTNYNRDHNAAINIKNEGMRLAAV